MRGQAASHVGRHLWWRAGAIRCRSWIVHPLPSPGRRRDSLTNDKVHSILEDSKGRLWIGTDGGGLDLFNPIAGTFAHYRHTENKNSLCSNYVTNVMEDREGNLWVSTTDGMSRYEVNANRWTTFTTRDGLTGRCRVRGIGGFHRSISGSARIRACARYDPSVTVSRISEWRMDCRPMNSRSRPIAGAVRACFISGVSTGLTRSSRTSPFASRSIRRW